MKISIIGFSGSGKTMLAKRISDEFKIPHLQIDRIWFEAGGHKARTEEEKERMRRTIKERVSEFIAKPGWVSDGNYRRVQSLITEASDKVIFLDIPLYRCLLNHLHRVITRTNRHPETTIFEDLAHVSTMLRRSFTDRNAMREMCIQAGTKLIVIKNYNETSRLLKKLV